MEHVKKLIDDLKRKYARQITTANSTLKQIEELEETYDEQLSHRKGTPKTK